MFLEKQRFQSGLGAVMCGRCSGGAGADYDDFIQALGFLRVLVIVKSNLLLICKGTRVR
jgi:hypothetical protein